MNLIKKDSIEEYILNHLKNEPILMLKLVQKIKLDRPGTTKQAVYYVLRKMRKDSQIVIYKGVAALNISWINSMINFYAIAKYNYTKTGYGDFSILNLENKEKIKYYFNDPIKADIFWTHILYLLMSFCPKGEHYYLYNPHQWFLLLRSENEQKLFDDMVISGRKVLQLVGSNTYLDKYVNKYFNNNEKQFFANEKAWFSNNYYLNVIGDYLIEVYLDKTMSQELDDFYFETKSFNAPDQEKLKNIIDKEGRVRIVVSRNNKKAEKIKKRFDKYFY